MISCADRGSGQGPGHDANGMLEDGSSGTMRVRSGDIIGVQRYVKAKDCIVWICYECK